MTIHFKKTISSWNQNWSYSHTTPQLFLKLSVTKNLIDTIVRNKTEHIQYYYFVYYYYYYFLQEGFYEAYFISCWRTKKKKKLKMCCFHRVINVPNSKTTKLTCTFASEVGHKNLNSKAKRRNKTCQVRSLVETKHCPVNKLVTKLVVNTL